MYRWRLAVLLPSPRPCLPRAFALLLPGTDLPRPRPEEDGALLREKLLLGRGGMVAVCVGLWVCDVVRRGGLVEGRVDGCGREVDLWGLE